MKKGNNGRHQSLPPISRDTAATYIEYVIEALSPYADIYPAGSYRRGKNMVGDLDFIICVKSDISLMDFWKYAQEYMGDPTIGGDIKYLPRKKEYKVARKAQYILDNIAVCDFYICEPDMLGPMLLYLTGSADHNRYMRFEALKLGYTLSQHGLKDRESGIFIGEQTEAGIFKSLKLEYKKPSERNLIYPEEKFLKK